VVLLAQVAGLDHQITAVMHSPGAEQLLDPARSGHSKVHSDSSF